MELLFQPMTTTYARLMLTWQYPEPYTLYSFSSSDDAAEVSFFTDPANAYYAVTDERGDLIAYRCYGADAQVPGGDYAADALDTGGGLRPDLTGRGLGLAVLNAGLAFGQRTFAPPAFRVTVAAFNQRALLVVTRAGFQPTQQFTRASDSRDFLILIRPA
jgi:[ribosomal protein S18]-alanine N-acetyltransferase